jgi:hypothetical protein
MVLRSDMVARLQYGGPLVLFAPTPKPVLPRVPPAFSPAGCQWRPVETAWFCRSVTEAGSPAFEGRVQEGPLKCAGRMHAHICTSATLRTLVAGPFFSRPGEWHSMGSAYDQLLKPADRVVGYVADVVNSSGLAVPYPPIHLHHIHVMRGEAVHWYETHGDYQLDPARGYWRSLPAGYCDDSRGEAKRTVLAQINDVRFTSDMAMSFDPNAEATVPHNISAAEIEWYLRLELAVAPAAAACRPLTKLSETRGIRTHARDTNPRT